MRVATAGTAVLAGVAVVVAVAPVVPVAVGLALGATVATVVALVADTDRYALVGATLLVGVGSAVLLVDRFPAAWARTPLVALWTFGSLSLFVVGALSVLGFVGRRVVALFVPDENADSIWNALSAFAGTLFMAWSVITAQEKLARTGVVTLGGFATMVLDAVGYEVPVPVPFIQDVLSVRVLGFELAVPLWVVENGVDATMVVFVGCVIVGFHTLGTLAATWEAVKDTTGYADETSERTGDAEPVTTGSSPAVPSETDQSPRGERAVPGSDESVDRGDQSRD